MQRVNPYVKGKLHNGHVVFCGPGGNTPRLRK